MKTQSYTDFEELPSALMEEKALAFYQSMRRRRTIRDFSTRKVPRSVLENCLLAAGTAPSGANHQPWHFCVVEDSGIKGKIRQAAEAEERAFYNGRAPQEWLDALAPLGTDEHKPFLDDAPALIAIFAESHGTNTEGEKQKNYYVTESVGIATGFLIAALHQSGLCCLTHTPSPMGFLSKILSRPKNERAFLLLVVGYPKEGGVEIPVITKKPLEVFTSFY